MSFSPPIIRTVNSTSDITMYNQIILGDTSGGNVSVYLPNPYTYFRDDNCAQGFPFQIKKIASANSLIIRCIDNSVTIEGNSTLTLTEENEAVFLRFDSINSNFVVVSNNNTSSSSSGTVTSISAGTGMNFSTITTSGSVAIDTSKVPYLSSGFSTGLLKWNGSNWTFDNTSYGTGTVTSVALSGGTGISISGSPIITSGTITVTNTAPDQTVTLNNGTGISVTGTYPTFTITNSSPDQTVVLNSGNYITVSGTYPTFTITGNPPRLPLILTTSDNSLTSTVSETKVFSQQIAGSTFAAGDAIVMLARFRKVGTAGATATFRFYINSSDSLSGATLIATSALSGSTNISAVFQRNPVCKSSNIIEFWTASSSVFNDMTQTTTAVSNIAYTYVNAYYWIVSIQMANTADTGILSSFLVERIRL